MSNDVNLSTFPSNRTEALTMLYLQNQNLSDKTPREIVELYFSVLAGVRESIRETKPNSIKALK
ncbi:hypothetical protein MHI57_09720 [Cytobacillus sp. FSL K6-0129]|uniref:hypothetical protein n=1 Tax=Cytobacillus sp. FSL K6-0129 TaxID=2921421 RepID=UPI0030F9FC08